MIIYAVLQKQPIWCQNIWFYSFGFNLYTLTWNGEERNYMWN